MFVGWRADIRAAWKGVRAGRWTSLLVAAALAVGTGACLAAGAIAYAGLLAPLPLRAPEQVVSLRRIYKPTDLQSGLRLAEFEDWRARIVNTTVLAASARENVTLRDAGEPRQVRATYVAGAWFDVVGARADAGRLPSGDLPLDAVAVSRTFAARLVGVGRSPNDAVGRSFVIGDRALTIQAVLPESFAAVDNADVWVAARGVTALTTTGQGDVRDYMLVGRLEPGRTVAQAQSDASRVLQDVTTPEQRENWRVEVRPLREALLGDARPVLLTFLAAALLVLIVACANVAMVLANRAVARAGEAAVRLALGANRRRLVRVAWIESAMLAVVGTGAGVWVARLALGAIARQTGLGLPGIATLPAALPVVAGALGVSAVATLVCGVAPVFVVRQASLTTSMRAVSGRSSRATRRWRSLLVVSQLATAVVLLTGAVLLGRTLTAAGRVDPGVDAPGEVATLLVPIGESSRDAAGRLTTVDRILEEVRRLPGVRSAGIGAALPPSQGAMRFTIRVVTRESDVAQTFEFVPATVGYLESLGARVTEGRLFTAADMLSDPVAVLSESAARHLSPVARSVVDRQLNLPLPTARGTRVRPRIVGIVRDMHYAGLDVPASGAVYVPWAQLPMPRAFLSVRTSGRPAAILPDLVRIVRAADPSMPLSPAQTLDDVIEGSLAPRAARFGVAGVFAAAAVVLALLGLSGALVRSVMEQRRELAIRAAIGATPQVLMRSVVLQGAALAVTGIAAGLAVSAALEHALSSILFGVTPHDPITYAGVTVGVLAVALAAAYLPARRAAASDPLTLLHAE